MTDTLHFRVTPGVSLLSALCSTPPAPFCSAPLELPANRSPQYLLCGAKIDHLELSLAVDLGLGRASLSTPTYIYFHAQTLSRSLQLFHNFLLFFFFKQTNTKVHYLRLSLNTLCRPAWFKLRDPSSCLCSLPGLKVYTAIPSNCLKVGFVLCVPVCMNVYIHVCAHGGQG